MERATSFRLVMLSGRYTPFTFQASSLAGNNPNLTLQVVGSKYPDIDDTQAHLIRHWTFEPENISSATFDITIQYDDADIVGNEAELVPIKFNTDADTSDFSSYTLDVANNALTWRGLTNFSAATAGALMDVTTPVELIYFEGRAEGNIALLSWETATELNNDRFEIEWSRDAASFVHIGEIDGNGTTDMLKRYMFVDNQPLSGINYYRLRQVDYDGQFEYSPIISVELEESMVEPGLSRLSKSGNRGIFQFELRRLEEK